jgi:cytochrome b subunit of formate dehydrogenase
MSCTACHTGATELPAAGAGHALKAGTTLKSAGCADCHEKLGATPKAAPAAGAAPSRLQLVLDNIAAYRQSFHARPSKADQAHPNATCDNCHDTHSFAVPPASQKAERAAWRLSSATSCASQCHSDELDEYSSSAHGKAVLEEHKSEAAVCSDCHTAHSIGNTSASPVKLAITAKCGSCHAENYASYKATYHGQISTLGFAHTAKCFDCHGSHGIVAVADPESKVHPNNRMETCQSCHNGKKGVGEATAGFATFQPHGNTSNFDRYPQMWIAYRMMVGLLVGTFAFFWLHTAMWFVREWKERGSGGHEPRVAADALPPELRDKHVQRFSWAWRVGHLLFAVSLMLLTLTGMPLFYPEAPWAAWLMNMLGGPHIAGLIHRSNAVVFAGVFFWHLVVIAVRIWRNRSTFRLFGPDSLVPNLQDLKDIVAMFRWFVGKGPRPVFDRWTYWEKFDYWAPFWGVTIIGVSGLVMWLPQLTASVLPGWVFNVAAIFHGEEAFLAVVFLFTVHFFNNHFRPEKFPIETVMFTGSMSLEAFKREHPLHFQRLRDSGELQRYLVDAPSPPMRLGSKVLGFTLIAVGLVLLFGVAVGFMTAA